MNVGEDGIVGMGATHRAYLLAACALALCALVLQLYLTVSLAVANGMSAAAGVVRFLSYFTVITNTLAAIMFTGELIAGRTQRRSFFTRPGVVAAITAYMIVVGITYSLLLRATWNPVGLQLVADRLLHDVMPIVTAVYWLAFAASGKLHARMIGVWLIYPIVYLLYSLGAGAISGFYPYPFIDAGTLGYAATLVNSAAITVAFVVLAWVMITVDRYVRRVRAR